MKWTDYMAKVNEVEVKVDKNYAYYYCDDCASKIPDFIRDTSREIEDDEITTCDGCGKDLTNATT